VAEVGYENRLAEGKKEVFFQRTVRGYKGIPKYP
jgi:hypothetical protein